MKKPGPVKNPNLTPRELRVANLVYQGHTDKEIAAKLNIDYKTVCTHTAACYKKMGLLSSWGNPRVRLVKHILSTIVDRGSGKIEHFGLAEIDHSESCQLW